jgi:hypothetical protein
MRDFREYKKALVIAPNTLLGRFLNTLDEPGARRSWLYYLLMADDGRMLRPTLNRWWDHPVGGLVLYALGVRTVGEMERVERVQRQKRS